MSEKKKKGKKAKGETEEERLAREAEEQKQRDLEAKRLADELEKKRLEELRIKAERKAFREAELERLKVESDVLLDKLQTRAQQFSAEIAHESARLDWAQYREPTDEPDAFSERDMNTFITLMKELKVNDITEALDAIRTIERVAEAVEVVYSDRMADKDIVAQARSCEYLKQFSQLILDKLDASTVQYLRFVDSHMNEKAEINVEEVASRVSIGMWASFNDNRPIRKSIQLERMNVQLDIPKQILNQETRFVHRVTRIPIDTISYSAYLPSGASEKPGQSTKYIVGDLLYVDILIPPPQAFTLRAKKWTIRDRSPASLIPRKSPYPSSVAGKCYFRVPDEVILSDDVRAMLWNDDTHEWVEDGITEYQYSEASRMVQFYLAAVGTIALVRDRIFDMPYRKWSLVPVRDLDVELKSKLADDYSGNSALYERQARFTVETQRFEIIIDIVGTKCRLMAPDNKQLSDLLGKELDPGVLLLKLQRRGINLLPTPRDLKSVEGITAKNEALETEVLAQMARCASAFEFVSSPWGQKISETQAGILVRESTVYTGTFDTFDYECVLAELDAVSESSKNAPDVGDIPPASGGVKFTLVMGNEYGNRTLFSHMPRPTEVSHLELIGTLANRITDEAKDRAERCNARFSNTVFTLLRLVRPLSLS